MKQPSPIEHRLPPHSVEAEQGVLGCILTEPGTCMDRCVEFIGPRAEMFYDLQNQTIWNVLLELTERQTGLDLITVQQRLLDTNRLEAVGGLAYLMSLGDAIPSVANLPYYLDILREKFLVRTAIRVGTEALQTLWESDGNAEKLLLEFESRISALTEAHATQQEEHIKEVIPRVLDDINEHYQRGSMQLRGLPTGPPGCYLDKLIGGIRENYYVVISGRPGDGKSSLAMNIVEYLAVDYVWREPTGRMIKAEDGTEYGETVERTGIPVGVFSIEMDSDSMVYRMVMGRADVDMASFKEGFAAKGAVDAIAKAALQLNKANIYIDATPAQTIGQIAAKARRMVKQHGIKLFVLDYLQLVEQERGNGDRVRELTAISRKIMAIKKQLKVPWIVLAQMNRNIEQREGSKEPVMSDLKDCGAIEQDADAVLMLFRPSKNALEKSENKCGVENRNDIEVIDDYCATHAVSWARRPYRMNVRVAKNRHGPLGDVGLLFQKNLTRFLDWRQWKVLHGYEERAMGEKKPKQETDV